MMRPEFVAFFAFPAAQATEQAFRQVVRADATWADWVFAVFFIMGGWSARNMHELAYIWEGMEKRLELAKSLMCGFLVGYASYASARIGYFPGVGEFEVPDLLLNVCAAGGAFLGKELITWVWRKRA